MQYRPSIASPEVCSAAVVITYQVYFSKLQGGHGIFKPRDVGMKPIKQFGMSRPKTEAQEILLIKDIN
jgi:hypothetical protein